MSDEEITVEDWTLFDKIMYGGFGYSTFCLPENILVIAMSVIYPPLGLLTWLISQTLDNKFPYFTYKTFIKLWNNIEHIAKSIIYTMLFYIPGLIYVFNQTIYLKMEKDVENEVSGKVDSDGNPIKISIGYTDTERDIAQQQQQEINVQVIKKMFG